MKQIYLRLILGFFLTLGLGPLSLNAQFIKPDKLPGRNTFDRSQVEHLKTWKAEPKRSLNEVQCTFVDPVAEDSSLTILFNQSIGFYVGTNGYEDKQKANYYDLSFLTFDTLYSVIFTAFVDVPDSSKEVVVRVFDGTGEMVGTQLGSKSISLRAIADSFDVDSWVEVEFDNPIRLPASHEIYISVDFSNLSIFDDELFGLASSGFGQPYNVAWEQWSDSVWYSFADTSSWNDSVAIAIYPILCGEVVTPVKFSKFDARQFGSSNRLEWTTETESSNRGFEIQRSEDGVNFKTIDFVASKAIGGNSTSTLHYSYADNAPLTTNNYYRIKQVDLNLKTSFSKTLLLLRDQVVKSSILQVYPNPAKSFLNLVVTMPSGKKGQITITDLTGKVLMQQQVNGSNSNQNIKLNISNLSRGAYFVKSSLGDETVVMKFMKE